ncbi:hypothetical protein JXI42_00330 [bacterium]|nr:hypothetical protein [bacterium]
MSKEVEKLEKKLSVWLERYHTEKMTETARKLPVRHDMVTLLEFVRENIVIGTQCTGNMPLKMVRAVTVKFNKPPILDHKIGKHTYRLRSEENIWPLYFLHILAEVGGLLAIAPTKQWRLKRNGVRFMSIDPLYQIAFMLSVWWYQVNWIVAFPFSGMGDELPPLFNYYALEGLLSLTPAIKVPVSDFAGELIEKTGLVWRAQDISFADMFLQSSVERMIIRILNTFGAVECEYQDEQLGKSTISKLQTFKIVPFGRALLESLVTMSR